MCALALRFDLRFAHH